MLNWYVKVISVIFLVLRRRFLPGCNVQMEGGISGKLTNEKQLCDPKSH